jgi:hypothetical protein
MNTVLDKMAGAGQGLRRAVVLGLTALGLMLGLTMVTAVPASAATDLGGLSVEAACDNQWGVYTYAQLVLPGNAYSWRCRLNLGGQSTFFTVDLNRECARVYGPGAWAAPLDSGNPYSWRCFR